MRFVAREQIDGSGFGGLLETAKLAEIAICFFRCCLRRIEVRMEGAGFPSPFDKPIVGIDEIILLESVCVDRFQYIILNTVDQLATCESDGLTSFRSAIETI